MSVYFLSHYAKLKKMEEEREKELAEKYRDRVNAVENTSICLLLKGYIIKGQWHSQRR